MKGWQAKKGRKGIIGRGRPGCVRRAQLAEEMRRETRSRAMEEAERVARAGGHVGGGVGHGRQLRSREDRSGPGVGRKAGRFN